MTSPDVCVSLGSNINPFENLAAAVRLLRVSSTVLAVSSAFRTAPQGFTEQPHFLNLAVKLHTEQTPEAFKRLVLEDIERRLGRVRDPLNKNAPRTIDVDISLWGEAVLEYGAKPWQVPDPDIVRFAHVALPLAEVAPGLVHPLEGETLADIAARFANTGFERLPLSGW